MQLDVHPESLCLLGQVGPLARVFVSVLRALGGTRDPVSVRARREHELVRIECGPGSRRRSELDTLQLGIVAALVDALGGTLQFSAAGLVLELPSADSDTREPRPLALDGELVVVGTPHFAERIRQLLEPDLPVLRVIPSAEAALAGLERESAAVAGVVSMLLLPEQSGIWFVRELARRGLGFTFGPVVITPERVRLPADVRCVEGPLTRERLLRALRG